MKIALETFMAELDAAAQVRHQTFLDSLLKM